MTKNNDSPATKKDVEEAVDELAGVTNRSLERELQPIHKRLGVVEDKVTELDEKVAGLDEKVTDLQAGQKRLESGMQSILKVVQGIDEQLREHRDLPERVARLERTTFR